MSFIDKAKQAVEKAVDSHGEKIQQGLDKAGEVVDRKTGGKYTEQIRSGTSAAGRALDGLDGKQDDMTPREQDRPAPTDSPNVGPDVDPGSVNPESADPRPADPQSVDPQPVDPQQRP